MSSISSVSHFSAKCRYCTEAWPRRKPEILKGNLALHCCAVLTDVKFEYMKILAEQPSPLNKMQRVNSSNSSITNYFDSSAECGIPFSTVSHPFFVDFVKSLCFEYNPPGKTTLSTIILNKEISSVLNKINEELKNEDNLTL
ncbi:12642_t:CDS:2, partial [Entrophospora sp. SA101]